jgi:hypothetical protein
LPKNQQYQTVIEKNFDDLTEEIEEIYDGVNNVGIAAQTVSGNRVLTYYDYSINELLFVNGIFYQSYFLAKHL